MLKPNWLRFLLVICCCCIFSNTAVFGAPCRESDNSDKECCFYNDKEYAVDSEEELVYLEEEVDCVSLSSEDTYYNKPAFDKCQFYCVFTEGEAKGDWTPISCADGYVCEKDTVKEFFDVKNDYYIQARQICSGCLEIGSIKKTNDDKDDTSCGEKKHAKTCKVFNGEDDGKLTYWRFITECEEGYYPVEADKEELKKDYPKVNFDAVFENITIYKECALASCNYAGTDYSVGDKVENQHCPSEPRFANANLCDKVCWQKKDGTADWVYFISECAKGSVVSEGNVTLNEEFEGYIDDSEDIIESCRKVDPCKPKGYSDISVYDTLVLSRGAECDDKAVIKPYADNKYVNKSLVSQWELYCDYDYEEEEPELICRPKECKYNLEVNKDKTNCVTNDGSDGISVIPQYKLAEVADKTDEDKKIKVEEAKKKVNNFFGALRDNKSVWKDAEGNFNTARLTSDLTGAVVLGTVGGVVSGVVIKKKQLAKGFENLHCTVGGQTIANFGDDFKIGYNK